MMSRLSSSTPAPVSSTGTVPLGDKASSAAGLFFIATSQISTSHPA
jgi:hypothetical protein